MKACLLCIFLSGCALFVDMSEAARHKRWVVYQQSFVGQSIYRCLFAFCGNEKYPWDGMYLGETDLGNGVQERGFRYVGLIKITRTDFRSAVIFLNTKVQRA